MRQRYHLDYIFSESIRDFDSSFKNDIMGFSGESSGSDYCKSNQLTSLLDINAIVLDKKMGVSVTYSRNKFDRGTMAAFMRKYMEMINKIIKHCCGKENVEFTSSDFDAVDISQKDLDGLFN